MLFPLCFLLCVHNAGARTERGDKRGAIVLDNKRGVRRRKLAMLLVRVPSCWMPVVILVCGCVCV